MYSVLILLPLFTFVIVTIKKAALMLRVYLTCNIYGICDQGIYKNYFSCGAVSLKKYYLYSRPKVTFELTL